MTIDESVVRDLCTDAVFERGATYYRDGHVRELHRVGDTVTARVRGTELYDVRIEYDADENDVADARCTCPYDGSGHCKHVVAVSLAVVKGDCEDSPDVDSLLERASADDLREFARDALLGHPELREQFLAIVDEPPERSTEAYREAVDALFEEHTDEYPVVVEAIDFSRFTDLAERYREREEYERAARVYAGLADAIADNANLVDGAYDHYAQTLADALEGYVQCVSDADLDERTFEEYAGHLARRRQAVVDNYAEQYDRALEKLESAR